MPDEYAISDLSRASVINNEDLIELSTVDQTSETGYGSVNATIVQLATKMLKGILFASDLNTTNKAIIGAINEIRGTILSATLTAGSTTLTISDNSITTDSTIDIYTNTYGVSPSNVSVIAGSITLTFSAQANDIDVKVVIK